MIKLAIFGAIAGIATLLSYLGRRSASKWRMRSDFIEADIKRTWKRLRIPTADCDVLRDDYTISANSPQAYEMQNQLERLDQYQRRHEGDQITVKRSRIVCHLMKNGRIIQRFETTIDKDQTTMHVWVKMRDFIDVYVPENESEFRTVDYLIDLDFVDEPIDFPRS